MVPKEHGFNQSETASAWCARLAWRFPGSSAMTRDGEVIQRQHFCHHWDTICHPKSGYVTTKLHGTSTCGFNSFTLKALPRQWVALETANLQSLRSRMLTSVSPFFLISLLMVSMYLNFGLPLGLIPSTSMSNTVLVIWLSSLRLTCPYQRSRFCIRCVAIGWTVAASLISSFLLCSLRLTPCIHRNILISVLFISISSFFFIVQHSAPYVIVGFITVL